MFSLYVLYLNIFYLLVCFALTNHSVWMKKTCMSPGLYLMIWYCVDPIFKSFSS